MKAAIRYKYCKPGDLIITEVPVPVPGNDEILVKVKATTVNLTDCKTILSRHEVMTAPGKQQLVALYFSTPPDLLC